MVWYLCYRHGDHNSHEMNSAYVQRQVPTPFMRVRTGLLAYLLEKEVCG
jgi:hypothetical protein